MEEQERLVSKYERNMRWVTLLVGLNLLQMVTWPLYVSFFAPAYAGDVLVDPDLCWTFLLVISIMEGLFFIWLFRSRDWVVAIIACVLAWTLPLALTYMDDIYRFPYIASILPALLTLLIINMLWLREDVKDVGGKLD